MDSVLTILSHGSEVVPPANKESTQCKENKDKRYDAIESCIIETRAGVCVGGFDLEVQDHADCREV